MKNVYWRLKSAVGFTLIDTLATCAVVATVSAIAAPAAVNIVDNTRLGMATRDVERELQFARLKAVATNRPMRVRFDCPSTGKLRVVELVGTPQQPDAVKDTDSYADRCSDTLFPYSPTGADQSRLTRPNNDGPIRTLAQGASFSAKKTLEFWPNGTVHADTNATPPNPWPIVGTSVTITVTRKGQSKNIVVNGFGKIQMDR
jgi:Tfp pilus assembly protein FimT